MKRVMKLFVSCTILALCFSVILCGAKCDDATDKIFAVCCADDGGMTLPVKFKKAWIEADGTGFICDLSPEDIKDAVDRISEKGGAYSAEIYGNAFVFITKTVSGGVHYYLVARMGETSYCFRSLRSDIAAADNKTFYFTFVPLHLLNYGYNVYADNGFCIAADREYETYYAAKDFARFYEGINIFDVALAANKITVKTKDGAAGGCGSLFRGTFEIIFAVRPAGACVKFRIIEE